MLFNCVCCTCRRRGQQPSSVCVRRRNAQSESEMNGLKTHRLRKLKYLKPEQQLQCFRQAITALALTHCKKRSFHRYVHFLYRRLLIVIVIVVAAKQVFHVDWASRLCNLLIRKGEMEWVGGGEEGLRCVCVCVNKCLFMFGPGTWRRSVLAQRTCAA